MDSTTLDSLSVLELLALHSHILSELRARGVLRTANNPVADYAEFLVCEALSLKRAPNSEKGYDATDARGKRYEIKARRQTKGSKPHRFSAIRDIEEGNFDYLVAVLFTKDFLVQRAAMLPRDAVTDKVSWEARTNASILRLSGSLWNDDSAQDITARLQQVQQGRGQQH